MAIISSGIWDIDPTVTDGTQLAGYLNELVKAINTNQSSATRPPMIKKGGLWTKTLSGSDIAVMVYDGTTDYEIGKIIGGDIQLDSIWTEVDGVAEYGGDIQVNGITVGKGNGNQINTVVGRLALEKNTGSQNVAIGSNALSDNTGSQNVAIGHETLKTNTSGNAVAIGYKAGFSGNIGVSVAIGAESQTVTPSGGGNTSVGARTLKINEADYNTAVGKDVLSYNTIGGYNTAVGSNSMVSNVTGEANVSLGYKSLYSTQAGDNNVAIGTNSMILATDCVDNVSIGSGSGEKIKKGSRNVFVGKYSGSRIVEGNDNICIGNGVTPNADVSNFVQVGSFVHDLKFGHQDIGEVRGTTCGLGSSYIGVVENNAVVNLVPPRFGGMVYIMGNAHSSFPSGPEYSQLVHYDVGGSLNVQFMTPPATVTQKLTIRTTPLGGTTGTDGCLNLAVLDKRIQIENRIGNSAGFTATFL